MSNGLIRLNAGVLTVLAALALAAAGCGDSTDDSGDGAAASQGDNSSQSPPASEGDARASADSATEELLAVMRDLRERYNAKDGAGFCAHLTEAGRKEVVTLGRDLSLGGGSCEAVVSEHARRIVSQGAPQAPVELREIEVTGDRAVVTINGGLAGSLSIVPFRLVKQGDGWKVTDPISASKRGRFE